jgi:dTDP-4-dehydrorhamnose reductase
VDDAEADPSGCLAANADGAAMLARLCAGAGAAFVGFSSDLVFDGSLDRPYVESDPTAPLNVYGRSKALAEAAVLAAGGRSLMVRTAAFFSPHDAHNFAVHLAGALGRGETFEAASDLTISPTYVPDLVDRTLDLLIDGESGVWHLANRGEVTWFEFAAKLAAALDLDGSRLVGSPAAHFGWPARRPARVALASERGWLMPTLDEAIVRFAAALTLTSPVLAPRGQARSPLPTMTIAAGKRDAA